MRSANYVIEEVEAAAPAATSTSHNAAVAWPYVLISVLVVLGLIGTALKLLRNQNE